MYKFDKAFVLKYLAYRQKCGLLTNWKSLDCIADRLHYFRCDVKFAVKAFEKEGLIDIDRNGNIHISRDGIIACSNYSIGKSLTPIIPPLKSTSDITINWEVDKTDVDYGDTIEFTTEQMSKFDKLLCFVKELMV